jgi:hypothetical protein
MNSSGNRRNLKASQPGNRNAEKTGVHSKRRRAEKASEVREAIDKDPEGFPAQDRRNALAEAVGLSELLAQDIAEQGITDRKGNPRRVVGMQTRLLKLRLELGEQIEAEHATSVAQARHAEPWSPDEGLRLLRNIAHNYTSAPAASIKAIALLDEQAPAPAYNYDPEFFDKLLNMTPEKLDLEYWALLKPNITSRAWGPADDRKLEVVQTIIRRVASRDTLADHELEPLYISLWELFTPRPASCAESAGDC